MQKTKKLTIAIFSEILNTHSGARHPIEFAIALSKHPQTKTVFFIYYGCNKDEKTKRLLEEKHIKLIELNVSSLGFFEKLRGGLSLYKIFPSLQVDLISFHGTLPLFFITVFLRIPIVTTYYGTQFHAYLERLLPIESPTLIDRIFNYSGNVIIYLFQAIPILLSKEVVAMSKYGKKEIQKFYGRTVPVIYPGATYVKQTISAATPSQATPFLLSVSRITPYKGFHCLLEAMKIVLAKNTIPVSLIIVGSSPQTRYLSYLRSLLPDHCSILTDIGDDKLFTLYQSCLFYVTFDQYLFFGLPVLEAAMHQKPSIVLNRCSAHEVIQDNETGYVVENTEEFAQKIETLLTHGTLRKTLGKNAQKRTQSVFSWDRAAQEYIILFQKLV